MPNTGYTITSSQLPGGPFASGEIKVITDNATYGTQWHAYQGTPPPVPVWRETTTGPSNPGTFAPGVWLVALRANVTVNWQSNPVAVTVVAGQRTRLAIAYT